ncbi:acid protease [Aspergillus ellipticus CBS 707.79]|uniref:Acid protease n=1 Tax=Aspergillus ellipticus CBS 707.79 TaxID=1448320 RepID=A0A319DK67_9EURO|nr:acid protease [Aspergillus ellipticus CBS 707.79]
MLRTSLLLIALVLRATDASSPLALNWSSQAYGPDGPWQAVEIAVGSNQQRVALYPGATSYTSTILTSTLCTNTSLSSTCYAAQAGTYNSSESTTAFVEPSAGWETLYWAVEGGGVEAVVGDQVTISRVVPNVSFEAIYQTYMTYPNGKSYPVSVGTLALGAPYRSDTIDNATLNMLASYLYTSGGEDGIPSYSYSMHVGSASPAVPGSLILGGYDKSRALGDITSQSVSLESATSGEMQITMKDITLGVAEGDSPFSFTSKSSLFLQSSGNVVQKTVTIDPTKPYLYLPQETCEAITSYLPVTFNSSLGLYFWDTTASDYTNITTSPTYLGFTFTQDNVSNQNITIKIPLSLLALTLEAPLVDTNTTYFPCFYSDESPVLGRAFLQAAFVATNYHDGNGTGTWFMAQAPGPDYAAEDITDISEQDTSLSTSSSVTWEESWSKTWHVLGSTTSGSSNSTTGNSTTPATEKKESGLSSGAKVGVGVGVGIGGAAVIAAGVWLAFFMRKRKQGILLGSRHDSPTQDRKNPIRGVVEMPGGEAATELESKGKIMGGPYQGGHPEYAGSHAQVQAMPHEMMGSEVHEPPRYELD